MTFTKNAIGVGLYSTAEASRLLRIPTSTMWKWIQSHVVPAYFEEEEKTITFAELMEFHFVRLFRQQGLQLSTIRKCYQKAASEFGDRPFMMKGFHTDGKTIFATVVKEDREL